MAVYVDEMRQWGVCRWMTCHLTADSVEELRAFAKAAGIPDSKRHYGASTPHYDLNNTWREVALAHGAIFVPAREQAKKRLEKKRGNC